MAASALATVAGLRLLLLFVAVAPGGCWGAEEQEAISLNATELFSINFDQSPVCFNSTPLGCFSMEFPWVSPLRPVPQPSHPGNISTHFYLFTRRSPKMREVAEWTPPDLDLSDPSKDWDPKRRTFFITHGLGSSSQAEWVQDMKDALLETMDANVFLTDWSKGAADFLQYDQAVSNTRVVGREMSNLIQHLITDHGSSPNNIHLIGHSLGAHASSYTCKEIKGISRLTALDPAQPAFEGFSALVRLDPDDAKFVEVIHTDAKPTVPSFGLGMIGKFGHVDYYVNGGASQPGCFLPFIFSLFNLTSPLDIFGIPIKVINKIVTCPHTRAAELYVEVIRGNCTFWGHRGNLFSGIIGFLTGGHASRIFSSLHMECMDDNCSPMNLDNENYPARGSFVVPTAYSSPYCPKETWLDSVVRQILLLPWKLPWLAWRLLGRVLQQVLWRLPLRIWLLLWHLLWHLLWQLPWSLLVAIVS